MAELSDDELLQELGVEVEAESKSSKTPREERIIAGFQDIERFFEEHKRLPYHSEDKEIFERLYAIRLDKIRDSKECLSILSGIDRYGLLLEVSPRKNSVREEPEKEEPENFDDHSLLSELGVLSAGENDITQLKHVKARAEIRASEEIAKRTPCPDFDKFKTLFVKVQEELTSGIRKTKEFKDNAQVLKGEFFILGGQKIYVAEMGEQFVNDYERPDRRLRVIYDNGTESDILLRSLQRALNKDETGRRITDPSIGPLFSDVSEEGDVTTGVIYVLRSKSDEPFVKEHRDIIHKIGVTSGDVKRRIVNAKLDPTFLMAEVEIVVTYQLSNINPIKLENLIHKFFESAKLQIEIKDRFGIPITPNEWFLLPLSIIDESVKRIMDRSIVHYFYDAKAGKIKKR